MSGQGYRGFTLWLTGLPCSGKTTLAEEIQRRLLALGHPTEHLDGDVIRQNLSKGLSFNKEDRIINITRVAFVASLLTRNGVATLVSFVSPYREMRESARSIIHPFIETHVRCSLKECERRDVKGMYKRARKGEIKNFTGVTDPYEEPVNPEIVVDTESYSLSDCIEKIMDYLGLKGLIIRNPFEKNERLTAAFGLASRHHFGQKRKGELPYITHPVAVARMLHESGYPESVVAAGLLHDVLEDSGCEVEEMRKAVGAAVTDIVVEVTDKDKTVSWEKRKQNHIDALMQASSEALAVACADKIHNIESLAQGYRVAGMEFSKQFSGGLAAKIGNYQRLYDLISSRMPEGPLLVRYRKCLEELKAAAAGPVQKTGVGNR